MTRNIGALISLCRWLIGCGAFVGSPIDGAASDPERVRCVLLKVCKVVKRQMLSCPSIRNSLKPEAWSLEPV